MLSSRVANPPQIVEMTEENKTAVVTEPESETEEFNLTQMFEQGEEPQNEESTEDESEEYEEESEEDETVLSQSNEDEDEEEEESSDKEVPKPVQKLLRQVNKLTARAKSAEEQLQILQSQKMAEGQGTQLLSDVHSMEDLQKYKDTAMKAKKFGLKNINKDYVEHNGEEYDSERIANLLEEADEALTVHIPAREKHIQQRAVTRQQMPQFFNWFGEDEHPVKQVYDYGVNLPELKQIHAMPNAELVFGLMAEGYASVQARSQAMQKAKPKSVKKKAEPLKSVSGTSAPPKRQRTKSEKILGNGNVSLHTFSQFLESQNEEEK